MSISAPCRRRLLACFLSCNAILASAATNNEQWVDLNSLLREEVAAPRTLIAPSSIHPSESMIDGTTDIDASHQIKPDAEEISSTHIELLLDPEAPPSRQLIPVPHGFVPVSLEERLQSLRNSPSADELITESTALVDAESIMRAVDEAFAEQAIFEKNNARAAVASQAAEAAGRATAELLINPPSDHTEPPPLLPASPYDKLFLEARDAYLRKDAEELLIFHKIFAEHPLADYITFCQLALELTRQPDASEANVNLQNFIEAHQDDYLGEAATAFYLREVGGRINSVLFNNLDEKLTWNRQDPVISAWRLHFQLNASNNTDTRTRTLRQAKALYRDHDVRIPALRDLGDEIVRLDRGWAWERVIVLLQKGYWEEVKRGLHAVPRPELPASLETLYAILDNPTAWFNRTESEGIRVNARLGVFAALRLARSQPEMAAKTAIRIESRLGAFWRALIWNRIGYHGVVSLNPKAPRWFARADRGGLDLQPLIVVDRDNLIQWEARAAIRAGNFYSLGSIIDRMPEHLRHHEIWTYWHARAFLARGLREQADVLLRRIAGRTTFYGWLASDALGIPYSLDHLRTRQPSPNEMDRWNSNPSISRALLFYRMHLYWDGHREWNWAMKGLKGREFISLAGWAKQHALTHRMINTSLRSGEEILIEQRYPMPHQALINQVSQAQQLPSSWVYGLIRQESRFIPAVKSSVGAQGLMQVMPSTAAWIANRIGIENYREHNLTELEMNLVLGTAYLRMLYAELDQSYVLATAAYNAGPARARVWRATLQEPIEAAAFIETIPFYETRDYVKNVLANMQTYSLLNGNPIESFSRLLGRIVPASTTKSELP